MSIKIADLEYCNQIEELFESELKVVVGGAIVDLESQLEKLNPQTAINKTLLSLIQDLGAPPQ